jgi:hypothetical protein
MIKQATRNGFALYEKFKLMLVGLSHWVGLNIGFRAYCEVSCPNPSLGLMTKARVCKGAG